MRHIFSLGENGITVSDMKEKLCTERGACFAVFNTPSIFFFIF